MYNIALGKKSKEKVFSYHFKVVLFFNGLYIVITK